MGARRVRLGIIKVKAKSGKAPLRSIHDITKRMAEASGDVLKLRKLQEKERELAQFQQEVKHSLGE